VAEWASQFEPHQLKVQSWRSISRNLPPFSRGCIDTCGHLFRSTKATINQTKVNFELGALFKLELLPVH
jgi:hypothetical protein